MELYIFKTNIQSQEKALALNPLFEKHPVIKRWTVDTEDIDKVLRIEAQDQLAEGEFMNGLKQAGYQCEVMPY